MHELSGRRVGYARVSTDDQNLDLQMDALREAGCVTIWSEKRSAAARRRPQLQNALDDLEPGDTLVVWRLDRLARSITQLLGILEDLKRREVEFLSLHENFETKSAMGRLVLHILAALAEFERGLISERTKAGMRAAKARGRKIGNAQKVTRAMALEMRAQKKMGRSAKQIACSINRTFGLKGLHRINFRSVYNYWTTDKRPLPRE